MVSSTSQQPSSQALLEKLLQLPPDKRAEVEDFVDFLLSRNQDQPLSEEPLLAVAGVLSGEPLTVEEIETELYGG